VLFFPVYPNPHPRSLCSSPAPVAALPVFPQDAPVSHTKFQPPPKPALTHLNATLTSHPASVASKGFTENLTPLEATLTKNTGVGVSPAIPFQKWNSCSQPTRDTHDHLFSPLIARHSFTPARSGSLRLLESALPKNARVTPLQSALTKSPHCNPFRIRTSIKNPGGGPPTHCPLPFLTVSCELSAVSSHLQAALPVLTPAAHCTPHPKVPECLS
jgi:hypothetical protein